MSEKRVLSIKVSEICYFLCIASLLFSKGIGLYDGQFFFKLFLVVGGIFWVAKMLLTTYTLSEMVINISLLLLAGIVYLVSGEKGIFLYIMLIVGSKNIPMDKIFKVICGVWSVSFGGLFFLTAMHVVDSPFKVHEKIGTLIIRWGLGCAHPNVLHISYLLLCMLIGYICFQYKNRKAVVFLFVGNLYVFLYSFSSTGFIAVTFFLLLYAYWMYRKKLSNIEKGLVYFSASICVLFSMLAPILFTGRLFEIINNMLNTRLRLSKHFLTNYPFSLFGTRLTEIVTSQVTMDCSYVYAYVVYGCIMFVVLIGGYFLIIRKYCKEQKGRELCIILASLVAGVTEPFLFNTSLKNISILFFRDLIYREKEVKQTEKVFLLLSKVDKEVTCDTSVFQKVIAMAKTVFVSNKKRILTSTLAMIVISSIVCLFLIKYPDKIMVPRAQSDLDETWYTELNVTDEQISEEDLVYGQVGEDGLWLALSGRAVQLEIVRDIITCSLLIGLLTMGVCILYFCVSQNGRLRER